jgi:hypothetical protein
LDTNTDYFSSTNRLHIKNINFQDTIRSPDPKAKGTVQSNAVRKKSQNIQTLSIFSSTNRLHRTQTPEPKAKPIEQNVEVRNEL